MKRKSDEKEEDIVFDENGETESDVQIEDMEEQSESKLKKLRTTLEECQKERGEYLEGWQRAKADLINERKLNKEREKRMSTTVKEQLLRDVLPALDSFDMAFANKATWEKVDTGWRSGVEYIHAQLLTALNIHGLSVFSPLGQQFDPVLHESIEMNEIEHKKDDHKIIEVLQRGYKLGDTLIRPAKVKVGVYKKKES